MDKTPYFLLLLCAQLAFSYKNALAIKDSVWKAGVETGASISYSGLNQNIMANFRYGKNTVYFGPRISLTKSYLPGKGVWGINTGVRHDFAHSRKALAFFAIDYQNSFMRPFGDSSPGKFNVVHEINFSYGGQVLLFPKFSIGNNIGFGRYWEYYLDLGNKQKILFAGYSGLIRLYLRYEF